MNITINARQLVAYQITLQEGERSIHTIEKYMRDLRKFFAFLGERTLSKLEVLDFKRHLVEGYAPASVSSMLAAVNGFLNWLGLPQYKVKPLKIQRDIFAPPEKELTQREYERLVRAAERRDNGRLSLVIQTICATGIRVSELQYITVAALQSGRAVVFCKGKNRTIFLPRALCKMLWVYCKKWSITQGAIFVTRGGKPLNRSNIWRMMKSLYYEARVLPSKIFPHNLRHLFARTYYKIEKDISRLADILGHSSMDTTRIYTMETGIKYMRQLDRMKLICARE